MTKIELKKILKPLMKECIKELLMEAGMSKILSETVQKVQQVTVNDSFITNKVQKDEDDSLIKEKRKHLQENHKRMLEEIGKSGYVNTGFNPFLNTTSLSSNEAPVESGQISENRQASKNIPPAMNNINPDDPGVDIRGIMNLASGKWKAHMSGKG